MAVRQALLQQLLELGETERVEIAHALLESVNDHDDPTGPDRERLDAAIDRSLDEIDAGALVSVETVISALRARRRVPATR